MIQLNLAVIGYYDEGVITKAKDELCTSLQESEIDIESESVTRQNSS